VSFISQQSDKGVPVCTGSNPSAAVRYWKYTDWDKSSLYFIAGKSFGGKTRLKARAYYDNYFNVLDSYDNATYTTQTSKKAFTSVYDDKTFGGMVEFGTELPAGNSLKLAVHDKYDMHREYNVGQQAKEFGDNTLSIAAENTWKAAEDLSVIAGAPQDFRTAVKAEDLQNNSIVSFDLGDDTATSYQLALVGRIDERQEMTAYVARTTRFPTLKDRYSYRLGSALPNPGLEPEKSWNYGIDYSFLPTNRLHIRASVYRSRLTDVIQQVNNVASISGIWVCQFQNTGKGTFTGSEYSLDWTPISWLNAYAAYSYIDRKNDSQPDLLFVDVPRHKLTGYLRFLLGRDSWALVEADYNTRRYSTSDGKYTAGAYGLVNLRLSAPLFDSLSVRASVENLFDRDYRVAEGYPEPGRQYLLSLAYSL
jgi:iron complex outermembrane receptor protein